MAVDKVRWLSHDLHTPEDDVTSLGVSWDGTGDGGKTVRVENGLLPPCEPSQVLLQLNMDVYTQKRIINTRLRLGTKPRAPGLSCSCSEHSNITSSPPHPVLHR